MNPADVLNPDERRQIMEVLYDLTIKGGAPWQVGPRADEFSLGMGSHNYVLYPKDHDGVSPFILDIYTDDGSKLAAIISKAREQPEYDSRVNQLLERTYNLVYRQVSRPEESVRKLMSEIREADTEREPPF